MKEKMTRSIFILALVMGIIVEKSTAEMKYTFEECYKDCTRICMYSTYGSYRAAFGCTRCDFRCRKFVNGEVCLFRLWCWKLKKRGWNFFFPFLLVSVTTGNTSRLRTMQVNSHYLRRIMIIIKVNKSWRIFGISPCS